MTSATASTVFTVLSLATICTGVLFLLRHFLPLRTTPAFILVPIFLALVLPTSAILLVPIDLASSSGPEDEAFKGIWLAQRPLLVAWRLLYWLTFVLTWFVLPLLGEYMDSGYRDPKQRLLYSLRSNGRYQLIMLGCAIAGLIYLVIDYGFDFTAIRGLAMALAYVWGLILAIYLAGHGMVAIPRTLIRNASTSGRLQRVQARAVKVHEKLGDAILELDKIEAQILQLKQRKTGSARDFHDWIEELVEMTSQQETRIMSNPATIEASAKLPAVITERYLADLTRRMERVRHRRVQFAEEWNMLVQSATDLQAVIDSRASKKLDFGREKWKVLTPYTRYLLHARILPAVRLVGGGLLAGASVAVILSEIIKFPAPQYSPVSLTVVHHPRAEDYQVGLGGQAVAAAWIAFMCVCALSSVNEVPVWNGRALVKRHTHPEAACWYAGQIAKLTVPLAYNFLTFLPRDVHKKTVFYKFLGKLINLTPLGTWFDYLFPMFILIPVCATLFNLYGRIKSVLGFELIDEGGEDDSGFGGWREGRDLIAQDLSGTTSVGLQDSPRPSLDQQRPTRWVPAASRPTPLRQSQPVPDPEPEEENYFTLLGRRIKNTVDTFDTPRWMQSKSDFKRPRWMGGSDGGGGQSSGSGLLGRFGGSQNNNGQITI